MSDNNPITKLMDEVINKHNFIEVMKNTYGVAILDNGMHVKVLHNFEGVCENWKMYKEAIAMQDEEAIGACLMENTRGGLIDTGSTVLDIQTIIAMYPVYRSTHNDKEAELLNRHKEEMIDRFLYWNTQLGELE